MKGDATWQWHRPVACNCIGQGISDGHGLDEKCGADITDRIHLFADWVCDVTTAKTACSGAGLGGFLRRRITLFVAA